MALRPVPAGYSAIVAQFTVTVGVAAAALSPAVACDAIVVIPDSGNTDTVYWGGSAVTTSNGVPIADYPEGDIIPLNSTGKVYLISGTASQGARVLALKG